MDDMSSHGEHADDAKQDSAPRLRKFLVFESVPQHTTRHDGSVDDRMSNVLHQYNCVGSVRAVDEHAAVMAVMSYTRRIGKYAVIEATFIDFNPTMDGDEPSRPQLNA